MTLEKSAQNCAAPVKCDYDFLLNKNRKFVKKQFNSKSILAKNQFRKISSTSRNITKAKNPMIFNARFGFVPDASCGTGQVYKQHHAILFQI